MTAIYRCRLTNTTQWFDVEAEGSGPKRDPASAAEAFVIGMADHYQLDDGDTVTVEMHAEISQHHMFDVVVSRIWHAQILVNDQGKSEHSEDVVQSDQ